MYDKLIVWAQLLKLCEYEVFGFLAPYKPTSLVLRTHPRIPSLISPSDSSLRQQTFPFYGLQTAYQSLPAYCNSGDGSDPVHRPNDVGLAMGTEGGHSKIYRVESNG